jgi:hypothetical protein
MADTKISALTVATTPLAGTEVLPIVQGGATKQVSVANLTAGRAVSATQMTLTTGNLIVASGQGIDFSATPGTGTSELFSDYEEGTCSLAISDGTLSSATTTCKYTRVGRQITVLVDFYAVNVSALSTSATLRITGMPFSTGATTMCQVFCPNSTYNNLVGEITTTTAILYKIGNSQDATFLKLTDLLSPTTLTLKSAYIYFV